MTRRGHARERGLISSWWERAAAKRAAKRGDANASVTVDAGAAHRTEFAAHSKVVQSGVMRDAVDDVTKATADQIEHDAAAELRMPGAVVAATRIAPSVAAERALRRRLGHYAPETMGYLSPWLPRLAGLALFLGGCMLNATTYASFEPPREDGLTRLLEQAGLSAAWALGACQMLGFTLLGYGIAYCLVFGLVPKRGMYCMPRRRAATRSSTSRHSGGSSMDTSLLRCTSAWPRRFLGSRCSSATPSRSCGRMGSCSTAASPPRPLAQGVPVHSEARRPEATIPLARCSCS